MAEIIDVQMPADQVINAVKQMQAAIAGLEAKVAGLGRGGGDFSETFLRSERRVSRSAANIASNMLSGQNAVQALAQTFLQLEYATKLGLGLGIGIAVGVALFEAVAKSITEVSKAKAKLDKDLGRPLSLEVKLSGSDIKTQIDQIDKDVEDLQAKRSGTVQKVIDFLTAPSKGNQFAGESEFDTHPEQRTNLADQAISDALKRRKQLAEAEAEAALKSADIKKDELSTHEHMAELEKVELDLTQKRSKLMLEPWKAGSDITNRFKEWIALGQEADAATAKIERKSDLAQAGSQTKFQTGRLDVDLARREVTESSQNATADALATEVQKAQLLVQLADKRLGIEGATRGAVDEQTAAINAEQIALAKQQKAQRDREFKDTQESNKAKGDNQETMLQQQGFSFAANLLKTRQATEQKIAALLREQKGDLAAQAAIAGQLQLRQQAKQALQNPQGVQAQERAANQADAAFDAKISYFLSQLQRGVKFDKDDPMANIIQQYLANTSKLTQAAAGKDKKDDFSSVASLAGQDFSSLKTLGGLDFSGMAKLAGLSISIQ